ncbi:hypothetical protein NW755_000957 [Fusarium falciforme]|uniref:Uncharacterized protein n=1 Tax=Fusarium falciforme TaxID=195108 RepID=A0A9W8V8Q8_9HYPO|nr:hypothetical protein NW755_000957 [Fusarium falciforme]
MLRGERKSTVATGLDDSTLFFATDNAVPVKDGEEGQGPEQLDLRITLVDAAWATRARMGEMGGFDAGLSSPVRGMAGQYVNQLMINRSRRRGTGRHDGSDM